MTFDEIFQNYIAQGFTKPAADMSGIETLLPPVSGVTPIIPVQEQGGGDGPRGVGSFGNLDPATKQTITVDTYSDVLGPPGAFEFSPTEIEAYRNINSGLLQDYRGYNVQPMFSNTGATFGLAGLAMRMMGMQPKTVGGFVPNSYRGYFDTPASFFRSVPNFIGNALGLSRAAEQAAQQDVLEKTNAARINAQQYTGGGGGGDRAPSSPARTSQGVTSAQHSAFRN